MLTPESSEEMSYAIAPFNSTSPLTTSSKFSTIPTLPVLEALADVYFTNCQNQPYCFFLERPFRQRLADGSLPNYLLMAFVATAARYSTHRYFENRQTEAIETYSKNAWLIVLQQVFSSEQGLDLCAVQATNLLAVIDFTGMPLPIRRSNIHTKNIKLGNTDWAG